MLRDRRVHKRQMLISSSELLSDAAILEVANHCINPPNNHVEQSADLKCFWETREQKAV